MNIKILLPILAILGFAFGFFTLISPFYVTGGLVGFKNHGGDPPTSYIYLLEGLYSMIIGVVVMAGSAIFGMTFGLAAGISAAASDFTQRSSANSSLPGVEESQGVDNVGGQAEGID